MGTRGPDPGVATRFIDVSRTAGPNTLFVRLTR